MDIVIPLGKDSLWQDNEIRYCLRSIDKYLKNYGNIYLIGECPKFLNTDNLLINKVIHIPFEETENASKNIYRKLILACKLRELTNEFLYMNDDHFFLQDTDIETYPYYHKGFLLDAITLTEKGTYRDYLRNTYNVLKERKAPQFLNFDIHTPVIIDKERFLDVTKQYDWLNTTGYTIKSLYLNSIVIGSTPIYKADCKIRDESLNHKQLKETIKDWDIFSIGNNVSLGMEILMKELYPVKSKYEI